MALSQRLIAKTLITSLSLFSCGAIAQSTELNAASAQTTEPSMAIQATQQQPIEPVWSDASNLTQSHSSPLRGTLDTSELKALNLIGEQLFTRQYTFADGAGRTMATQAIIPTKRKRPPRNQFQRTAGLDANACMSCHNQPVVGGAGDFTSNVFVSEGFSQTEFDSTDPQFSNERNSNHLFGAGLIELLAREMTKELQTQRNTALQTARDSGSMVTQQLSSKSVQFGLLRAYPDGSIDTNGIEGIDSDLIIKPFSQKGVMTSIRQFTINALNHHHGMQAEERFGARWTGEHDFDEDGHDNEMSSDDISALVAWQASLPPPTIDTTLPNNWIEAAQRGEHLFSQIQCQQCHISELPLDSLTFSDPSPYDNAGTLRSGELGQDNNLQYDLAQLAWSKTLRQNEAGQWMVPLFGDLKRHVIADNKVATLGNELLSQRFVERDVFITGELWGIGSTAPYGHRGDLTTLTEVIEAHGGEGRASRDAWLSLTPDERNDILAFLKRLVIKP